MTREVLVSLPWPTSVNTVWRNVCGKTLLSKQARTYRKMVGDAVLVQCIPRFVLQGRLSVTILAHPPDNRVRDLDNLLKAPLDALKAAGVIPDDSLIDGIYIGRRKVSSGGHLTVQICEMSEEAV